MHAQTHRWYNAIQAQCRPSLTPVHAGFHSHRPPGFLPGHPGSPGRVLPSARVPYSGRSGRPSSGQRRRQTGQYALVYIGLERVKGRVEVTASAIADLTQVRVRAEAKHNSTRPVYRMPHVGFCEAGEAVFGLQWLGFSLRLEQGPCLGLGQPRSANTQNLTSKPSFQALQIQN